MNGHKQISLLVIIFLLLLMIIHPTVLTSSVNIENNSKSQMAIYDSILPEILAKDKNKNQISDILEVKLSNETVWSSVLISTRNEQFFLRIKSILESYRSILFQAFDSLLMFRISAQNKILNEVLKVIRQYTLFIEEDANVTLAWRHNIPNDNFLHDRKNGGSISIFKNLKEQEGHSLTVAILDSGVSLIEGLRNKVIYFRDVTNEFYMPRDPVGHGTMVASIIAADPVEVLPRYVHYGIISGRKSLVFSSIVKNDSQIQLYLNWYSESPTGLIIEVQNGDNVFKWSVYGRPFNITFNVTKGLLKVFLRSLYGVDVKYVLGLKFIGYPKLVYSGINPQVKLAVWKIFRGYSTETKVSYVLEAINDLLRIYKRYNISIVNLSITAKSISVQLDLAVNKLCSLGIIVISAAGNYGGSLGEKHIYSPGSAMYAITVGALNSEVGIAFYSSVGGNYTEGTSVFMKPDIVWFGGGLLYGWWPVGLDSNDGDFVFSDIFSDDLFVDLGTSFSTAYITGYISKIVSSLMNQGKWSWGLSQVLYIKSLILGITLETAMIGAHEVKYGNEKRDPPPLNYGLKDPVEGFGMPYFPAILKITESQPLNIPNNITVIVNWSRPLVAIYLNTTSLLRITVNMEEGAYVTLYSSYMDDGSPVIRDVWRESESKFILGSKGTILVAKIYRNETVRIFIRIEELASRGVVIALAIGAATILLALFGWFIVAITKLIKRIYKKHKSRKQYVKVEKHLD